MGFQRSAVSLVRRIARRAGIEIHRTSAGPRLRLDQAFAQLKRVGIEPASVIDVGVGYGTPELYEAWPDARYLLIEPLEASRTHLERILTHVRGEYELAAASSRPGSGTLRVALDQPTSSTLFPDDGGQHRWTEQAVRLVRIDDTVHERDLKGPYLLKIDVQGAELEALKGASSVLESTLAVVVEVSLFRFFRGGPDQGEGPELADVVGHMSQRGFAVYDIVGGHHRFDGALAQVDLIFVPHDSPQRQSHRYSAV